MRTYDDHLAAVREAAGHRGTVTLPLLEAVQRRARTATDTVAQFDSPRFHNSQMDGYALPDTAGGSFTVGPTIAAGADAAALYPGGLDGLAAPIMTGAPVPRGTACVVPVEDCTPGEFAEEGAQVTAPASLDGKFVRAAGSDARRGEVLVPAGTVVDPIVVATLAGQDLTSVTVTRPARVVIVTGGKEIGSQIPDSNGPMLAAACAQAGIEVADTLHTDDDPGALRERLDRAIATHGPDAVLTSGGISHGKFEVVRDILEPHGWFGHVAQQPGGPQGLAVYRGTPCICMPGNPVSTLVSFRLYVAPVLGAAPGPQRAALEAHEPVAGLPHKERFYRAVLRDGKARVLGGAGSHLIAQAVGANCLIRIPAGHSLPGGADVVVYPF